MQGHIPVWTVIVFIRPSPYKLLMEGSIYMMDFEDDNTAYEDYQELLGADGQRISNSRFNRYESSAPQSDFENEADDRLEELYNNMPEMSVEEILILPTCWIRNSIRSPGGKQLKNR